VFIDPEECDRVLEGRLGNQEGDEEVLDADLGESAWWEGDEPGPVNV